MAVTNFEQTLQAAIARHRAGQFTEAEAVYQHAESVLPHGD